MISKLFENLKHDKEQFINLMALEIAELYTAYPTSTDINPIESILAKYITKYEGNNNQAFL